MAEVQNIKTVVVDLSKYIDFKFWGDDHPHVRGHRIRVATIAHVAQNEDISIEELAADFTLSESEILAALLYYEKHKQLIEAAEQAEHEQYKQYYES